MIRSQLRNNKDVICRHTNFINYSNQKQLHASAKYSSRHQAVFVRQSKDKYTAVAVRIIIKTVADISPQPKHVAAFDSYNKSCVKPDHVLNISYCHNTMGTSHVKALGYLIRTEGHILDVPNREHTTVAMTTGV